MSFLKEFTMILSCSNISKSFGEKHILKQVSFHLEDHEKAAIVGINGAGKSTLLKIIIGELACDEGCVALSKGASIGYLAQHQDLDSESTIHDALLEVKRTILQMEERIRSLELDMKSASGEGLENMLEEYSRLTHQFELEGGYACRSEITGVLKGLGFAEEEFSKPINALSGGQKTRVSLGKLLLTKPDILLLDEPTNHLDITSKEILESALCRYTGTVLYVSHDRYFINRTATRILDLTGQSLINYIGSYDYYLEKKDVVEAAFAARNSRTSTVPGSSQSPDRPSQGSPNDLKLEWKAQKEEQARIRRIQNELRKTEESIHALETRDSEIDALLTLEEVYTDVPRLMELNKEKEEIAGQLEKLYQSWEELAEEA